MKWMFATGILMITSSILGSHNNYGVEMVKIPGGTFQMGMALNRADEQPVHQVTIRTFYLSRTEVNVGQFRTFVNATGYRTEAEQGDGSVVFTGQKWEKRCDINWQQPGFNQNDQHPVTCVSWNDCQKFITWLNAQTGKCYRFPTEAEWEYAANGSNATDIDSRAWFEGNAQNSTHPVGQKQPNGYGLYDMLGNVWEWCQDWYGSYPSVSQNDPTGPESGLFRVNRGGAWYGANWSCVTRRGKNTPDDRGHGLGFRLAADADFN